MPFMGTLAAVFHWIGARVERTRAEAPRYFGLLCLRVAFEQGFEIPAFEVLRPYLLCA